jgi:hypothetical protein
MMTHRMHPGGPPEATSDFPPHDQNPATAQEAEAPPYLQEFQTGSWQWLRGVSDLHVYCLPCVYRRLFDEIELAKQFRAMGYRAFVSKRHHCCNADSTKLVMKHVPGIQVFGGVVLNWCVGGLNPHAVDAAILMGAKVIWMGNMHAGTLSTDPFYSRYNWHNLPADHPLKTRPIQAWMKAPPINVIDLETGELAPPVYAILDLIAAAGDVILNTCHISYPECAALVPAARTAGITKIMIDHAHRFTLEEQRALVAMGAYLEYDIPKDESRHPAIAEFMRRIGPEHCVLTSGMGAETHCHPIDEMRHMMVSLRMNGLSEKEIDLMAKTTPAKLLSLDEEPKPWRGYI